MTYTLDKRAWLQGETRLSDPQVRALGDFAERGTIAADREGFGGHRRATIAALAKHYCVEIDRRGGCCGTARITQRGRNILGLIKEASAKAEAMLLESADAGETRS